MKGINKTSYIADSKLIVTKNRVKSITFKTNLQFIDKKEKINNNSSDEISYHRSRIEFFESEIEKLLNIDIEKEYNTSILFEDYKKYQDIIDNQIIELSNKIEQKKELIKHLIDEDKINRIVARQDYYKRRKEELVLLTECNDFTTFLTITLDEDLNEEQAKKEFTKARKRLMNFLGVKELKGIVKFEKGSINERAHFHLILDIPYICNHSAIKHRKIYNKEGKVIKCVKEENIHYKKSSIQRQMVVDNTSNRSKKLREKRERLLKEGQSLLSIVLGLGFCQINRLKKDSKKAVSYVAKYIAKDMENKELHKRNVWILGNLDRPKHIIYDESIKEVRKILNNDFYTEKSLYQNEFVKIITYQAKKYNSLSSLYSIADRFDIDVNIHYIQYLSNQMNVCDSIKTKENKIIEEALI